MLSSTVDHCYPCSSDFPHPSKVRGAIATAATTDEYSRRSFATAQSDVVALSRHRELRASDMANARNGGNAEESVKISAVVKATSKRGRRHGVAGDRPVAEAFDISCASGITITNASGRRSMRRAASWGPSARDIITLASIAASRTASRASGIASGRRRRIQLRLIGDFNNWDRGAHSNGRAISMACGASFLPDEKWGDKLVHGSRVKVHVVSDNGGMDRIPAYIRRVVQEQDHQFHRAILEAADTSFRGKIQIPSLAGDGPADL